MSKIRRAEADQRKLAGYVAPAKKNASRLGLTGQLALVRFQGGIVIHSK
ncbi:MAG: hypothetical protein ACKVP0_20355 [Pirellulaceae bacterium]